MPMQVCMGAMMQCSFGMAPSSLVVIPAAPTKNMTFTDQMPDANIMDHIPMVNIMPFGMCMSIANPMVASATAAALGVLTPMPCIPATPSPWVPGAATVMLGNRPTLDNVSQLMCIWGGVIQFGRRVSLQLRCHRAEALWADTTRLSRAITYRALPSSLGFPTTSTASTGFGSHAHPAQHEPIWVSRHPDPGWGR